MKTAVVLTGHMRDWQTAGPGIQYLIERYNADVFIATWNNLGYWTSPENDPTNTGINIQSPPLDIGAVNDFYHPKGLLMYDQEIIMPFIDHQVDRYKLNEISVQIRPRNIVSQFWIQARGLESSCMLYDTPYEYIIRLRPDLVFLESLPDFDRDTIYVLNHPNHEGNGVGDMFMAMPTEAARVLVDVIDHGLHLSYSQEMMKRFCPHLYTQKFIEDEKHVVLNIAKTLAHTPNGQYKDWIK